MKREPKMYVVRPGTPSVPCRAENCKKPIYFVRQSSGSTVPVDCGVEGGRPPDDLNPGFGVNHYGTCPGAAQFHRRKKP